MVFALPCEKAGVPIVAEADMLADSLVNHEGSITVPKFLPVLLRKDN